MSKRLEMEYIDISQVEFAEKTELCGSVLYINKEELISQFDTSSFETCEIIIARPGDSIRMLGINDCTQPRVKPDAPDTTFPGILGKLAPAGDGRTIALRGVLVTELHPIKANIKHVLDMSGPAADISFLARHIHIVLDVRPKEGVTPYAHCQAQKQAALKVAVWLAKLGIGREPDERQVYELTPVGPGPDGKPLPKVAYLASHWAGFDTQQFFYYGQSPIGSLPFPCHPNEILDGALVYHYLNTTYFLQEEAMIKELYNRHGKDIEFVGMIITLGKTETTAKQTSSMIAAEFAKDYLKADITINTKFGMGHCQLEQQMLHIWSEQLGMTAVTVMPAVSSEKPGDLLVISDPRVDAIVHSGDVQVITWPHMDTLLGVQEVPALRNVDLQGPFTNTTNCVLMGGHTMHGANYVTDDLNLKTTGWRWPTDG